jgi:hypothetical protein
MVVLLLVASSLYVPVIVTICLGAKISRCQYVNMSPRDITTYLRLVLILASYISTNRILRFAGQAFKMSPRKLLRRYIKATCY